MTQDVRVLKAISWRDLCPWLMLSNSIGIAIRPSVLLIAFVGLLLSPLGWTLAEGLFLVDTEVQKSPSEFVSTEQTETSKRETPPRKRIPQMVFWTPAQPSGNMILDLTPGNVFAKFSSGHLGILDQDLNTWQFCYYFVGTLWMLGLWALLGGMICRIASTHYARDERMGPIEAFHFCVKRYGSLLISASIPLILILCFMIPMTMIGWLINVGFFAVAASWFWFVVLFFGAILAVLLIPLFFGWPLLWPAITTENTDPFNAVSRSFAYPTQRPFHYAFYMAVILLLGFLGSWVITLAGTKTIEFTKWGVSWGAGTDWVNELDGLQQKSIAKPDNWDAAGSNFDSKVGGTPGLESSGGTPSDLEVVSKPYPSTWIMAAKGMKFWENGIIMLTIAFDYAFFFVAATGLYLLLRKDTDFTELDEVFVQEQGPSESLPKLKTDPNQVASESQSGLNQNETNESTAKETPSDETPPNVD